MDVATDKKNPDASYENGMIGFACDHCGEAMVYLPADEIKGVWVGWDVPKEIQEKPFVVWVWTGQTRHDRATAYRKSFASRESAERVADFLKRSVGKARRIEAARPMTTGEQP